MSRLCTALKLLSLSSCLASAACAATATFFPTSNMTDTAGDLIQAHGGNIVKAQGDDSSWYWFGEDKTGETSSGHFIGVNCYTSTDFASWKRVGHVLSPIANTNISSESVVERPKVIYNDKNKEYVMYFHGDTSNYGAAQVGVATSKTIDGQYKWRGNYKPFGRDSRDMTIWKDPDDGTAYLIFATDGNADFQIATLDADYYNVAEVMYTFKGVYQEAPGVFKIDGKYYLLFSPQDGWTPTDNAYYTSSSMKGPWSSKTLLAPAGSYAYNTQNAYDVVVKGTQGTVYLYLGDHWNAGQLGASTYSFYPVVLNAGTLSLHYTGGWTLDAAAGTFADLPFTLIQAANSSTPAAKLVSCKNSCAGGKTVKLSSSSADAFSFTWQGGAGDKMLQVIYTYPGAKNAFRRLVATVDGVPAQGLALAESTRTDAFAQQVPLPVTLAKGSKVELKLLDTDSAAFQVDGVKVYAR